MPKHDKNPISLLFLQKLLSPGLVQLLRRHDWQRFRNLKLQFANNEEIWLQFALTAADHLES